MKRFIVIVLDGFGIGAMDDVPQNRPADIGANTCSHIFSLLPQLRLPVLEKLGLANALDYSMRDGFVNAGIIDIPKLPEQLHLVHNACYSFHKLAHFGADTYWGHQELLGSRPQKPKTAPFSTYLDEIQQVLEKNGHSVRRFPKTTPCVLVVDEAMTIGDNLETDLGNNFNVTAALDVLPFDKVRKVGKIVRAIAKSSRVIVFGSPVITLQNILDVYEEKEGLYAGVNAPKSGVYREGYEVVHMGYGVDASTQVPAKLAVIGIPSVLIGKVADIAENPEGERISGIDTAEVLDVTLEQMQKIKEGFICTNVQETDLAGHREDAPLYAQRLITADRGIGKIIQAMKPDDILAITADHGNDPTIGHTQHTREKTPLLLYGKKIRLGNIRPRETLADTGASVADFFGAPATESGVSYIPELLRGNND